MSALIVLTLTAREAAHLLPVIRREQEDVQVLTMSTPRAHVGFHGVLEDIAADLFSIAGKLACSATLRELHCELACGHLGSHRHSAVGWADATTRYDKLEASTKGAGV